VGLHKNKAALSTALSVGGFSAVYQSPVLSLVEAKKDMG